MSLNNSTTNNTIGIEEPNQLDVLLGRGGLTNNHPGNEWYRELIKSNRPLYHSCPKHTKLLVAKAVVQAVDEQGGRFMEKSKADGLWYQVTYKRAVAKTSQGLRERIRDESAGDNSSKASSSSSAAAPKVQQQQQQDIHSNLGAFADIAVAADLMDNHKNSNTNNMDSSMSSSSTTATRKPLKKRSLIDEDDDDSIDTYERHSAKRVKTTATLPLTSLTRAASNMATAAANYAAATFAFPEDNLLTPVNNHSNMVPVPPPPSTGLTLRESSMCRLLAAPHLAFQTSASNLVLI